MYRLTRIFHTCPGILARRHKIGLTRGRWDDCLIFEQTDEFWTYYPQPPLIIIAHGDGTQS